MAYVLIVDDDEQFAGAIAIVLRREGHEVAHQPDTGQALPQMRARPPDLVILDVMFGGDDFAGFELARAIRGCGDGRLSRVPILMLTGVNMTLDLSFDTLDLDNSYLPASDFVDKPVDPAKLVRKVDALLAAADARANNERRA